MGIFSDKKKIRCRPDPNNPEITHCERFVKNKDGTEEIVATADFAHDGLCNKTLVNIEGDPTDLEEMDKESSKLIRCKAKNNSNTQRPSDY